MRDALSVIVQSELNLTIVAIARLVSHINAEGFPGPNFTEAAAATANAIHPALLFDKTM